jgi:hypothetical protein
MTDDPNRQVPPGATDTTTTPARKPSSDDLGAGYRDADRPAPTANVVSQQLDPNSEPAAGEAPAGRRSSGLRWAIALGGLAVVVAVTAAILLLAGGRPTPSIAVGYMPEGTIQYSEYRLDLPGDQRQKLAGFLAKFPGFADQANVQTKLAEVFDRLITAISSNTQTYSADIEPWFGGQIGVGSGALQAGGAGGVLTGSPLAGNSLVVVGIKDQAKATAWLKETAGDSISEVPYGATTLYSISAGGLQPGISFAVTDKVLLGGTDPAVRAAIDSKGQGKLAEDAEFKAAFATVSRDYAIFAYTEYRAMIQSLIYMGGPASGLERTTIDDELLTLVPEWQASVARFEDDALVGESAYPSIDIGFDAKNRRGTLAGYAPPGTVAYAESHDVGAALLVLIDRFRKMPELSDAFTQIDQTAALAGGFDGLVGWWGDVAIAIAKAGDGSVGGGLLIAPTDAAKARTTFATLRSFLVLGGGAAGIELRDVPHGDATVTIIDLSGIAVPQGAATDLPEGVKAEIAYAVTDEVVVIGYGESFVNAVLDAGPGPSLADDARYKELLGRIGEENIGSSFMDVAAIRQLIEPYFKERLPADDWTYYEREILPYLTPLDALVTGARIDGGLNRLPVAFTVK